MPKEDKYYRALSALNDDDKTFLYKLIPNLSEQTEGIQTKVEELAEVVINRTGLSLAKIIEYHNEVNIKQGYYEPNINQYSRYYQNGFFNDTYDCMLYLGLQYILRENEQKERERKKEIKENYINKIEYTKKKSHPQNILDKLKGNSTPYIFAKAIYQGINGLNSGNIYTVIENMAVISTLLGNVTNDNFCKFKDFEIIIKIALECNKTTKKKKHQASEYIEQLTYAIKQELFKNPEPKIIKKDSRAMSYQSLEEWQLLYDFFKPIKNKIIETIDFYNAVCTEQLSVNLNLYSWLDVVIYAVYGYQKESKTEEEYFKKYDDLISAYKKLYMDNRKVFSSDFYSLNHFVTSFNVVVLCLYENVWNKDIEPFFN